LLLHVQIPLLCPDKTEMRCLVGYGLVTQTVLKHLLEFKQQLSGFSMDTQRTKPTEELDRAEEAPAAEAVAVAVRIAETTQSLNIRLKEKWKMVAFQN